MRNDRYLVLRDEEVWKVAIAWIYLRPSFGAATEKKDEKQTRLYSARKNCSYICSSTLSVPRSSQKNCLHLQTSNVCGKTTVHIFAPNRGYCLFSLS